MSYSIKLEKLAREKQRSREIVSEIINFGVTDQQKLDIIFNLSLTLENNKAIKDINEILKKYRDTINKEEDTDNNVSDGNKPRIILE
jgi:hypothetical protein|tara:strand:+ start:1820 stop:2080 length:261 start_codon:yes stop_codon:yes gene_type:complete